ncbi:MAG: low temperature requirement protein A, partial [Solirubrobacteraceae bacterium]
MGTDSTKRAHRRRPMAGRDPHESQRVATPLELLYDLTFAVAFGTAADQLAYYLAADHIRTAVVGFLFAAFAICWAWINYSWFASAYDTDDWVCRVLTMVQMVGVVVLALGLRNMFESVDHRGSLNNGVMVGGYVVMRVAMVLLWVRAARHDRTRRQIAKTYVWAISVSQIGWVLLFLAQLRVATSLIVATLLLLLELAGPLIAERRKGGGTPWHAHHIAERYGLLVIITLGEGVIGTVAALNAVVHGPEGWSVDAALVALAGIGLTFGMWWMYFAIPFGEVLHAHRGRSFRFGYGHLPIFAAVAATGGGLHVAADYLEHQTQIGPVATVLSVAAPVAVYTLALYAVWTALIGVRDPFHLGLLTATAGALMLSALLAFWGVTMAVCLVVVACAPIVTVIGYEAVGHRHVTDALASVAGVPGTSWVASSAVGRSSAGASVARIEDSPGVGGEATLHSVKQIDLVIPPEPGQDRRRSEMFEHDFSEHELLGSSDELSLSSTEIQEIDQEAAEFGLTPGE